MNGMEEKVVLLVEDNPDDALLILRALKKNGVKNEVIVARDGVEAFDYLFGTGIYAGRDTTVMPQLVLLDLRLPKVDGLEVLRRGRGDERSKMLPAVGLPPPSDAQGLAVSYRLHANSYRRKTGWVWRLVAAV